MLTQHDTFYSRVAPNPIGTLELSLLAREQYRDGTLQQGKNKKKSSARMGDNLGSPRAHTWAKADNIMLSWVGL